MSIKFNIYKRVMGITAKQLGACTITCLGAFPLVGDQDYKSPVSEQSSTDTATMNTSENNAITAKVECDSSATTCFVENDTIVRVNYKAATLRDDIEVKMMSIKDFLAKPLLVTSSLWSTANPANTIIFDLDLSNILSLTTAWTNKIQGFNLLRGDFVLRLKLNANPFQSGLLLFHFLPCVTDQIAAGNASYEAMHNANLITKLQQPHIEINARDAVAELTIPYVTPASYFDIKRVTYDWGRIYLSVLSPLVTGSAGEPNVNISLYAHLENVELAAPVVPQMSKKISKMSGKVYSAEEEALNPHSISGALSIVSKAASTLSAIPMLSVVTEPVSWVTRTLSGLASAFGWNKVESEEPIQPMVQQELRYGATSDGVSIAYPLSLLQDNRVMVTTDKSITNEDEMSFNFFKKIPHLRNSIGTQWNTSQATGTNLMGQRLTPAGLITNGTTVGTLHTITWGTGAPWVVMASQFQQWRGSFDIVFKFIKTQYHTGTVQITWTPATDASSAPTVSTSIFSLREVVDIRYQSEIKLNFPYMINTPYLSTTVGSAALAANIYSGYFTVDVINELRCPENASSTIEILAYVTAGDDFEYQVPGNNNLLGPPFSPQADDEILVMSGIAESKKMSSSVAASSLCIGEHFTSIKQLLGRASQVYFSTSIPSGTSSGSMSVYIWPWLNAVGYGAPTTRLYSYPNAGGDTYSWFANWYAFYRGGVRCSIQNTPITGQLDNALTLSLYTLRRDMNVVDSGFQIRGTRAITPWGLNINDDVLLSGVTDTHGGSNQAPFTIPYYNRMPVSLVIPQVTSDAKPTEISQPSVGVDVVSRNLNLANYSLYRSFKDDFHLTYFIGTVPYFISTT
jgi:hypothetical protein